MENLDKSILSRRSFFNYINNNNNSILNIHHTILININPKNFHNSLQIIQQDNDLSPYLFDNFSNNNVLFLELRKSHPVPAASQLGSRRTEASKTDDAVASGKRVLQDYSRVLSVLLGTQRPVTERPPCLLRPGFRQTWGPKFRGNFRLNGHWPLKPLKVSRSSLKLARTGDVSSATKYSRQQRPPEILAEEGGSRRVLEFPWKPTFFITASWHFSPSPQIFSEYTQVSMRCSPSPRVVLEKEKKGRERKGKKLWRVYFSMAHFVRGFSSAIEEERIEEEE